MSGDKQIPPTQDPDASLHIPCAADGSIGVESKGHQPRAQMPTQRGGQVDPYDQNSTARLICLDNAKIFSGLRKNCSRLQIAKPDDLCASQWYWNEDIVEPAVQVTAKDTMQVPKTPGIGCVAKRELLKNLRCVAMSSRRHAQRVKVCSRS